MTDIIKRLQKVSDQAGVLLTDPPRPTEIKAACDEAIQIITDLRGRTTWQPIETAPLTEMIMLYESPYSSVFIGYYEPIRSVWLTDSDMFLRPTHWQPLPAPPVAADTEAQRA